MDARQCGNDRPGFGVPSISPEIEGYNYTTFFGILINPYT